MWPLDANYFLLGRFSTHSGPEGFYKKKNSSEVQHTFLETIPCVNSKKLSLKIIPFGLSEKIHKTNFLPIWCMWYQFGQVLMVQITCALELKPHLYNEYGHWKKNYHFLYWKLPYSYNIGQNLPKKPISQKRCLERSKWAVLWNLSLIYIMIMICEKKLPLYVLEIALQLQHLPKKPISQKWYLERSKWAMLLNLSLIYIMIMIREKNYHFMYWNLPYSYNIGQNLPKKSQ